MKCNHCQEELGNGDPYDLMMKHLFSCESKPARNYRRAKDKEEWKEEVL